MSKPQEYIWAKVEFDKAYKQEIVQKRGCTFRGLVSETGQIMSLNLLNSIVFTVLFLQIWKFLI